jgi:hypothetical protein
MVMESGWVYRAGVGAPYPLLPSPKAVTRSLVVSVESGLVAGAGAEWFQAWTIA